MTVLPLIVDLDGTLIFTDLLHESALNVLGKKPFTTLRIPYWLSQGKAVLKKHLMHHSDVDPTTLPYNKELLTWLTQQRETGRQLILCTASHVSIATAISKHLGLFDEVIASNETINLSGQHKANALEERFGHSGFDYVGNSKADLHVWKRARRAILVNASTKLVQKTKEYCTIEKIFPSPARTFKTLVQLLRIHQWLKNALLFIPVMAAHQITHSSTWLPLFFAFFAFSLCASSVYVTNDLLDLGSDRQHPRKQKRPFASGTVPTWIGVILAPCLFFCSIRLALFVNKAFLVCLLVYFAITCLYSWRLKRLVLIDCQVLAMLYTIRIIAGASATSIDLSFWLLAFSGFLFLSLAFVKRYAELEAQKQHGKDKAQGRGYYTTDASLIQTFGITSGYASAIVLALYLNSEVILNFNGTTLRSSNFITV